MISKKKTQEVLKFNKSIARKISELLPFNTIISCCSTGSVYLIVRFKYCKQYSATKQVIIRISNHYQLSRRARHDVDLIVSDKLSNESNIRDCITETMLKINLMRNTNNGGMDAPTGTMPKE